MRLLLHAWGVGCSLVPQQHVVCVRVRAQLVATNKSQPLGASKIIKVRTRGRCVRGRLWPSRFCPCSASEVVSSLFSFMLSLLALCPSQVLYKALCPLCSLSFAPLLLVLSPSQVLLDMYEAMGDAIALQYGGSQVRCAARASERCCKCGVVRAVTCLLSA